VMIPERTKLLWQLIDAHEQSIKLLEEIEATIGDGPIGKKAKAHLQAEKNLMRRMMYIAFYNAEPPVDLPSNWEQG